MIDLRSDTVTRPTPAMREAMATAAVGDDVYSEDPTVNRLERHAAKLAGKAAAVFVPSGTMANLMAFLSQTRPGDSVILSEGSHPFHYEAGNIAAIGGILPIPVEEAQCKLYPRDVHNKVMLIDDPHFSKTRLVAIENTTNRGGGACYTVEEVADIYAVCQEYGLALHCDGARIFNACTATGATLEQYGSHCDTLSFCLSKGLGAPAGSILTGTDECIGRARRYRKMLGGAMRQAGILAAAGLHALEHHLPALAEDHRHAAIFRAALEARGMRFPLPSPTNIVYVSVSNPFEATGILREKEILVLPHGKDAIRVVFHRDIDDGDLDAAIEGFQQIAG